MGRKAKSLTHPTQKGTCGECYLWDVKIGRQPLRECLEQRNTVTRSSSVWRLVTGPSDSCLFYAPQDAVSQAVKP